MPCKQTLLHYWKEKITLYVEFSSKMYVRYKVKGVNDV